MKPSEAQVQAVMKFVREHISEEKTDEWIDALMAQLKLPKWIPGFIVRRVLDAMFPEKVLNSIESLLMKATH